MERRNQNRGGNESKGKRKEQPLAIDVDAPVRERRTKAGGTDVFRTTKSGPIVDAKGKLSEDWEVRRSLGRRRRRYQDYYNRSILAKPAGLDLGAALKRVPKKVLKVALKRYRMLLMVEVKNQTHEVDRKRSRPSPRIADAFCGRR